MNYPKVITLENATSTDISVAIENAGEDGFIISKIKKVGNFTALYFIFSEDD